MKTDYPILTGIPLIEAATTVMKRAHKGQFRADGVTPYVEHPLLAAEFYKAAVYANLTTVDYFRGWALALVHDTMEADAATVITRDEFFEAGLLSIYEECVMLTHRKEMTYLDYILKIRGHYDPIVRYAKRADFKANRATIDAVPDKKRAKTMLTKWELAEWILNN